MSDYYLSLSEYSDIPESILPKIRGIDKLVTVLAALDIVDKKMWQRMVEYHSQREYVQRVLPLEISKL
jgi:hypothetical protein